MSSDFKTNVNWSSNFGCPSGWSTPTRDDIISLISSSQAGGGACLYEQQGWNGHYWSSTSDGDGYYYYLYVDSSRADSESYYLDNGRSTYNVRCVSL